MQFRNIPWSEDCVDMERTITEDILKRIFKIENISNKYFLFVKSDFYFKYIVNNIDFEIDLLNSNNEIINKYYKYKIRQPYTNKNWYLSSMRYGRRLLDDGFVFMFNSFEELNDINNVIIKWDIDSEYNNKETLKVKVEIKYNINFIKGIDNVYLIKSHDTIQELATPNSVLKDYDKQFDINSYDEYNGLLIEYHEQTLKLKADNSRSDLI